MTQETPSLEADPNLRTGAEVKLHCNCGLLHLIRSRLRGGTTFSPAGAAEKALAGRLMERDGKMGE